MEVKVMQVFYGADYLPYKDKDRIIHYPVVGGAFLGASDTTKIKFYIGEIGGANTSWLAIGKLANGKTIEKILITYTDENGNYALLELSSAWTQAKGDLLITLAGVEGTATMEYDEDTGLYTLDGNPVVGMTGSIKLSINYATPIIDYSIDEDTLTRLASVISQKLNTSKGIYVLDIAEAVDVSMQVEGQLFYRKGNNSILQWHNNSLVELFKVAGIYDNSNFNQSTETLSDVNGYNNGKPMLFNNGTSGFYLLNVGYDNVNQYTLTYVQFGENNGYGYKTGFVGTETISQALTTMNNDGDIKTFANVEQFATINGQAITNGGNIEIQGGGSSNGYVDSSFVVSGDNAQIQFEKGDGSIDPLSLPLADGDNAGLMSPSDVNAITNLNNDVAALKQQTIRLLYTTKSNPTSADILAFVEASGYTDVSKYYGIAVIVKDTNHVWKFVSKAKIDGEWVFNDELTETYESQGGFDLTFTSNSNTYSKISINWTLSPTYGMAYDTTLVYERGVGWSNDNYKTIVISTETEIPSDALTWLLENTSSQGTYQIGEFTDFGLDTVGQFTNDTMGAIKGSNVDGKVYAESDGTGSVKGWNKLIANFAPLYDATAQYVRGDIRIYSTDLYVCTTDITTPEAFNSAHWTQIDLDTLLGTTFKGQIKFDTGTGRDTIIEGTQYGLFISNNGVRIFGMESDAIFPTLTNTRDLGRSSLQFKDLYLQGDIKDNITGASIPPSKITNADAIAQPYDNTATYAVGDLCMQLGQLYECNTAISTPEDFDVSHWTAIDVESLIPDLSKVGFPIIDKSDATQWTSDNLKKYLRTGFILKNAGLSFGGQKQTSELVVFPTRTVAQDYTTPVTSGYALGSCVFRDGQTSLLLLGLNWANATPTISLTKNIIFYFNGSVQLDVASIRGTPTLNGRAFNSCVLPALPDTTNNYVLKSVAGTIQWVAE